MENKVGYAYISLEEYNDLILKQENLRLSKRELETKLNRIYKSIFELIYTENKYTIKELSKDNNSHNYNYKELKIKMEKHGIDSLEEIDSNIAQLVNRYKEENKENENE